MNGGALQWLALAIEILGLILVTIELYLPTVAERLKAFFERVQFRFTKRPGTKQEWNWIAVGAFVMLWVVSVLIVSIWDPSMSLVANVAFTAFTILLGIIIGLSRVFVRVGVALGRGNAVGGVGLLLAMIGFTIEISQMMLT